MPEICFKIIQNWARSIRKELQLKQGGYVSSAEAEWQVCVDSLTSLLYFCVLFENLHNKKLEK